MVTDQDLLAELQQDLVEPVNVGTGTPASAAIASGLWTIDEILAAADRRIRRLLLDTVALLTRNEIVTVPNLTRQQLPQEWLYTDRVVWRTSAGVRSEVIRGESWEADQVQPDWDVTTQQVPLLYTDAEVPQREIQIMPASPDTGILELFYVAAPPALILDGQPIGGPIDWLPDEFIPAVKHGVEADLLLKLGRGYDQTRAAYGELRFQEGVEAATLMLSGWTQP